MLANLTSLLGARRAYVTEVDKQGLSQTVAAWEDGKRGPKRVYAVAGTPCAAVMRHGVQVVECELNTRYDLAESSLGYGCESFIGSPIVDHEGERIGQLCVFGGDPLEDSEMASAIVSLAAVRVSAELEHRRQRDSLHEQRRQLEVLLSNLPGMAYRCDADELRRLQFVSRGCADLTGYASQRLVSEVLHWSALIHEDDQQRVWDEISLALAENRSFEVQYRIVTCDGGRKWVWERGCGIDDDDGRISRIEGFISDATALQESRAALARSEAYASAIVATAAEGILTLDPNGRIESFNAAAEKMFGYKADELIGKDVHVLMPEPHRSRHTSYVDKYIETGQSSIMGTSRDVFALRKDGSEFPIQLAASEVIVDGNRCFAGIIRDVTEQKEAAESLKAVERRFRAVFDQRQSLVGILSTDGIVLEANQKSLDFAGLERDAVIDLEFWKTPWWRHSEELQERMRDAISAAAAGETVKFEASCPRVDGELATLDFAVRPIMDKNGHVVSLVSESRDITEQKLAEEEARQHRERIAHVTRLSTLGEMAAGIAHEINQPLTAISLFAQAQKRLVDTGNFEKMGEVCEKLNEHALRASDVVERMQAMARQSESTKETVSFGDLIDSSVKLAESEARIYDFQIDVTRCRSCPDVSVDAVQVQQVILNLLRNGMEAMLSADDDREKLVRIKVRCQEDNRVKVAVIDDGPGIADDRVDKLFTPFSTTKKSGMGMGLSISRAIVRAHGGEIGFFNNESRGATFWFTLPTIKRVNEDG